MARTEDQGGEAQSGAATTVAPDANALKVFISYSRADMGAADAMVAALEASGFAVTIDRRDLPYGEEWQAELSDFIARCDTVVWLVSPDSVKSKWVNWELGEVGRLSKRLVPVKARDTDPASLPEALGRIHLLPADGAYEAARHEPDLVRALNTDRAWLKRATSLGEDAREWQAKGRDGAMLLRGRALSEAEAWSQKRPRDAPAPSSGILELILASRAAQRRRQRFTVAGSIAAAIVAIALAGAAAWFGVEAREQAAEAERQRVVAEANAERARAQETEANLQRTVAQSNETRAREQELEANRQRQAAQANEQRAKLERNAALASEVSRVASVARPYLSSGRPDIALGFGLDVAPRDKTDEAPLSQDLELVLRRAYEQMPAPRERKVRDNAFRVAVSPDSSLVAVGTAGSDENKGFLHVFDASTLEERFSVKVMDDVVSGLDFSPDGKSLVVAGGTMPAVWDAETGKQRFALVKPDSLKGYTKWAEFAPDGSYIALSTNANAVLLFDAATGTLRHVLSGDTFEEIKARMPESEGAADPIVESVAYAQFQITGAASEFVITPDSGIIAITGPAARDGSVKLFDARTGMLRQRLTGGSSNSFGGVMPLTRMTAISSDGRHVVAAPIQLTIKTWSVDDGKLSGETVSRDINAIALTADGRVAISGHNDGTLTFRCLEGMMEQVALRAHTGRIEDIVIDTDRLRLATLSEDGTAKLWRLPSGGQVCLPLSSAETLDVVGRMRPLAVFAGHGGPVRSGDFSPDGLTFYTGGMDGRLRAWSLPKATFTVPDWERETTISEASLDHRIVTSQDGRTLFVSDDRVDPFTAIDLTTGATTRLEDVEAIAPEVPGGKPRLFRTPTDFVAFGQASASEEFSSWWDLRVSRDGTRALVAGDSASSFQEPMQLIDTGTGEPVGVLAVEGRTPAYLGKFFSRNSALVYAGFEPKEPGGKDGLGVWDAASGRLHAFLPELDRYSSNAHPYTSRDGRLVVFDNGSDVAVVKVTTSGAETLDVAGFGTIGAARAVTEDGSEVVEARQDGTVVFFPVGQGSPRTLRLDFTDPVHVDVSPDGEVVAVVDVAGVVTIASVAEGKVLHIWPLQADFLAIRFLADRRIAIVDQAGGVTLLPRIPAADLFADGPSFVDWLRAKRHGIVSSTDRDRFGLAGPSRHARPDLEAIKPFAIPKRRENPASTDAVKACDDVAANPYDRDRRAGGVLFDTLDAANALAVCEEALAGAPTDVQTIYQVARAHDKLGHLKRAFEGYKRAADDGYAIAMRGISRLIEIDKNHELLDAGQPSDWLDAALKAGDPWTLWTRATEMAYAAPAGEGSAEAFAMLASGGSANRAEAAVVLAWRLAQMGERPGAAERSRFYALLGLDLFDSFEDPAPFNDWLTYDWALLLARDMGATMQPAELVSLYRQARDWRAIPSIQ